MKILKSIFPAIAVCCFGQITAQTIQAWQSNDNNQFQQSTVQLFEGSSSRTAKIVLNENEKFQTIDGFGWTMTQGGAKLIMEMTEEKRMELLKDLYSSDGLYSEIVRIGLGATDLSEYPYTYEDTRGSFSLVGPDSTYLFPVLKLIKGINPNIKLLATPWTAPKWMKTNNSYIGGSLSNLRHSDYADYLVNYCLAMKKQGLPISLLSIQNEPLAQYNNPSMTYTQTGMYNFANVLGPKLIAAGLSDVKLIGYDHNCDNTNFPIRVAESEYISGTAFHLYAGDISAMSTVYDATGKDVYFTEQYSSGTGYSQSDFNWHIKNIMVGAVVNMSKATFQWNAAARHTGNGKYEPHTDGGCDNCMPAVTINGNAYSKNTAYYTVAHLSKVVRAGAQRIGTTLEGVARYLDVAAFNNNDGTRSLVVHNANSAQRQIAVEHNGTYFHYTIGSWATLSFLWDSDNTGIKDVNSGIPMSVFPNPTNNILNIKFETAENRKYELFSASGAKISGGCLDNMSNVIDMTEAAPGIYILKLQQNNAVGYTKIIKE